MTTINLPLLEKLCSIHGPSGDESLLQDFIIQYIHENQATWKTNPEVVSHERLLGAVILIFGTPETAVFAHLDSVGFTVAYDNHLHPIGAPYPQDNVFLVGHDAEGPIDAVYQNVYDEHTVIFNRNIERGTTLTYKPNFKVENNFITSPYLDNRLGVCVALQLAETLENGIIVFSTYEEHGGGCVPIVGSFIEKNYSIKQALICDITWVTEGVHAGKGVALSLRDRFIPRKKFTNRVVDLVKKSSIPFQLEVEGAGASDGKEIQLSHLSWDWMFIGAPESHAHTPNETVCMDDANAMLEVYDYLLKSL
jgi:putative aminopeptidase FrvX